MRSHKSAHQCNSPVLFPILRRKALLDRLVDRLALCALALGALLSPTRNMDIVLGNMHWADTGQMDCNTGSGNTPTNKETRQPTDQAGFTKDPMLVTHQLRYKGRQRIAANPGTLMPKSFTQ